MYWFSYFCTSSTSPYGQHCCQHEHDPCQSHVPAEMMMMSAKHCSYPEINNWGSCMKSTNRDIMEVSNGRNKIFDWKEKKRKQIDQHKSGTPKTVHYKRNRVKCFMHITHCTKSSKMWGEISEYNGNRRSYYSTFPHNYGIKCRRIRVIAVLFGSVPHTEVEAQPFTHWRKKISTAMEPY